jgi:hypothetical protein
MEKLIEIDGKQVPFKATARTPVLYRSIFGKDIFKDLIKLTDKVKQAQENNEDASMLDVETLQVFLNIAYVMARQADRTIPSDMDEWLDQFSMFSIYQILPELLELWNMNMTQISEAKKNIETLTGA